MYTKVCVICRQQFNTDNHCVKFCSDKCRTESNVLRHKAYNKQYCKTAHYLNYKKDYHKNKYQPVIKYCKICGNKLNDGRQTYCINCLLDDYARTKSKEAFMRLANRGYNKSLIIKELRNRR